MSAQALWSGKAVLEATGGIGVARWNAQGVSIDTRTLKPDDLFVALNGEHHDGHGFVNDAFAEGAVAALVDRNYHRANGAAGGKRIQVANPLEALANLAAHARARTSAKIVAVTGSVGKTGTKNALGHVLSSLTPKTHASALSHNNQWGVPLSLARLPADANFGIFEVGMNRAGEITPLSRLIAPDVALVTTVQPAHTEFFNSMEEIADAKAEIFNGLRQGGVAVLGCDDAWFERLNNAAKRAGAKVITFGKSQNADIRLADAEEGGESSRVEAEVKGRCVKYILGVPGLHWIGNSLAVLACCYALGVNVKDIAPAFASLQVPSGRGTRRNVRHENGNILLIDESYNANPASMEAAIVTLGRHSVGANARRILALGDMFELGDDAKQWHLSLLPVIKGAGIDLVFSCGEQMRHLFDALPSEMQGKHCGDAAALAQTLEDVLRDGDAVMVKGSNGMGMKRIIKHIESKSVEGKE